MLNLIDVKKPVLVNGVQYSCSKEAYEKLKGNPEEEVTIIIPRDGVTREVLQGSKNLFGEVETEPVPQVEPEPEKSPEPEATPPKPGKKRSLLETYNAMKSEKDPELKPAEKAPQPAAKTPVQDDRPVYWVKVKKYMTEKSVPSFDFMKQWNNDVPMPLMIMKGKVLDETKGMLFMELSATPEPSTHCFKCGRKLTHPISVLYGIGPECSGHLYINPMGSVAELEEAMDDIRAKMEEKTWKGWIIKSAIKEMYEITEGREGYEEGRA